jgi:hypothetical protein
MQRINIVGEGSHEGCRPCAGSRRGFALQLHTGTIDLQHDEGQPFDFETDGLVVLELHVQTQHLVVEGLGPRQVCYEQDDGLLQQRVGEPLAEPDRLRASVRIDI